MKSHVNTPRKDECPNCFHKLTAEEKVCPRCGFDRSKIEEYPERKRRVKKYANIRRAVQIIVVLIAVASAVVGKAFGNWWWGLLGFGAGIVFAFIALYITNLVVWYQTVRPYEKKEDNVEDDR